MIKGNRKNNNMIQKQNLSTEECVVAFVDLLGASTKIRSIENSLLNDVHYVYDYVVDYMKPFNKQVGLETDFFIFSDNIVISSSVSKVGLEQAFRSVVLTVSVIQDFFLDKNLLTRGGISIGGFYGDEIMLWGKALVDAYELESSVAVYPRVLIHPDLVKKVCLEKSLLSDLCLADADGLWYVNYFMGIKEKAVSYISVFERKRSEENSMRVRQKYDWFLGHLKNV